MQQVQGGLFARALQRTFGTQGKLSLQLDPVVIPTVQIANLADEAEGYPAHGSVDIPAGGAGNFSVFQIALPDVLNAYGWELRLIDMLVSSSTVQSVAWGQSPGLPGGTVQTSKEWRDTGRQGNPAAILQTQNNAALPAGAPIAGRTVVQSNIPQLIPLGWASVAGDTNGFMVRATVDNTTIRVTLRWLEVPPS